MTADGNYLIERGRLIEASDFVETVKGAVDSTIEAFKNINIMGEVGTNSPILDASSSQLQGFFDKSAMDKADAARRGYSNAFLVNTRRGPLLNRILEFARGTSNGFNINAGEVIRVKDATNCILSAFALASCVREAVYDLKAGNETIMFKGWSMFNNGAEPQKNDSTGKPIFNNVVNVPAIESKYIGLVPQSGKEKFLWYNYAPLTTTATWNNYRGTGQNRRILDVIGFQNRVAMGHVNVSSIYDYGYKQNAPMWNFKVGHHPTATSCIRDYVRSYVEYSAETRATDQTLYQTNEISASSVNQLLLYLRSYNLAIASCFYCVFSNCNEEIEKVTVTYVMNAADSSNGTTRTKVVATIPKGTNHTVLSYSSSSVFGSNSAKSAFGYWTLRWADSSFDRPNQKTAKVGDSIVNIQNNLTLVFTSGVKEVPDKVQSSFSWGYGGTAGCAWGGSIGDDHTEYWNNEDDHVATNLYPPANGKHWPYAGYREQPGANGCKAYITWTGNKQFNNNVTNGMIQRWATITVDLTKKENGGIPRNSDYKYFLMTALSAGFNENDPSHDDVLVLMADLNLVSTFPVDDCLTLKNYYKTFESYPADMHGQILSGFNYYLNSTWRNANGAGAPFWRKGNGKTRADHWINPFSYKRRFHVYPILGHNIHRWRRGNIERKHMTALADHVGVYHGKGCSYLDLDLMRNNSFYTNTGDGSNNKQCRAGNLQVCLRSLCAPNLLASQLDVYPPGCNSEKVTDTDAKVSSKSRHKVFIGRYGINNAESENITFKIKNGEIKIGIYIVRTESDGGGADQSWGKFVRGVVTPNYVGYNEDMKANPALRSKIPSYYDNESK